MQRFSNLDVNGAADSLDAFTILDVRHPDELLGELSHIPGSQNVPLDRVLSTGIPETIDLDAPLLIVCRSGARSARAAAELCARGFSRVHNLSGGMVAWNANGLPTATRSLQPSKAHLL